MNEYALTLAEAVEVADAVRDMRVRLEESMAPALARGNLRLALFSKLEADAADTVLRSYKRHVEWLEGLESRLRLFIRRKTGASDGAGHPDVAPWTRG